MSERPKITRRVLLAGAAAAPLAACAGPDVGAGAPPTGNALATTAGPSSPSASAVRPSPPTDAASSAPSGPASEVVHGPDGPHVALTFHGSGSPALAESLLLVAERRSVAVTVLAVGTWLQQQPQVAARILRGGHELGNHTLHHLPMRTMSEGEAYEEISRGAQLVRAATGVLGWFRPSGLTNAPPAVLAAAGRAGYRTSVSFDVDPQDYDDPGSATVVRRVLAGARRGSIISLHLGHVGTVQALPAILDGLGARGLRPVTLSSLLVGVAQ